MTPDLLTKVRDAGHQLGVPVARPCVACQAPDGGHQLDDLCAKPGHWPLGPQVRWSSSHPWLHFDMCRHESK